MIVSLSVWPETPRARAAETASSASASTFGDSPSAPRAKTADTAPDERSEAESSVAAAREGTESACALGGAGITPAESTAAVRRGRIGRSRSPRERMLGRGSRASGSPAGIDDSRSISRKYNLQKQILGVQRSQGASQMLSSASATPAERGESQARPMAGTRGLGVRPS